MVRQLCTSEDLLFRRYPRRFLVLALAPKYLIWLGAPGTIRTSDPQNLLLKKPTTGRRRIDIRDRTWLSHGHPNPGTRVDVITPCLRPKIETNFVPTVSAPFGPMENSAFERCDDTGLKFWKTLRELPGPISEGQGGKPRPPLSDSRALRQWASPTRSPSWSAAARAPITRSALQSFL